MLKPTAEEMRRDWYRKSLDYFEGKTQSGHDGGVDTDRTKDSFEVMKDADRSSGGDRGGETKSTRELTKVVELEKQVKSLTVQLGSCVRRTAELEAVVKKLVPVFANPTDDAKVRLTKHK